MFNKGDKIHLHDGRVVTVRSKGIPKNMGGAKERGRIRGFIRAAMVDCITGEQLTDNPDWHENIVTVYGHQMIVRNFVGIQSSHSSTPAASLAELGLAKYWGLGYHTQAQSSNFSTQASIDSSEYGLASTGGVSRATVSAGTQCLSGTWSLSQSFQYESSRISHAVTVNAIAQHLHSSVGAATTAGPALSLATFASSTKGTTQALNISYTWLFST